jgi:glutamate synthase (NADPH/NADH) small chain
MHGHTVTILEARPKPGGLNEYGIAAYKTTGGFAQAEVDWLLRIGGITIEHDRALGIDVKLADLIHGYDAVFIGTGLDATLALGIPGEDAGPVTDAIDFIEALRQAPDWATVPVGRNVVVIGGGMTAVDAAVQSKLLGAETVTIVYRRGRARMAASGYEQDHAATAGVRIVTDAMPVAMHPGEIEFAYTEETPDGLRPRAETFRLPADQVLRAIGQQLGGRPVRLKLEAGKIAVTGPGRTSERRVWAGGDCAAGGKDLTVTAVAEGRDAAEDIHAFLTGQA